MDFTDSESQSEQNDVPVPNVVGKLEKDASSTLSAAGFKVSKTYKYDDSVDAGKVVSEPERRKCTGGKYGYDCDQSGKEV